MSHSTVRQSLTLTSVSPGHEGDTNLVEGLADGQDATVDVRPHRHPILSPYNVARINQCDGATILYLQATRDAPCAGKAVHCAAICILHHHLAYVLRHAPTVLGPVTSRWHAAPK